MWWSNLFAGMSPANFFNFSFLPKYLSFFVQGLEYTLLLSIISVGLAVMPALALALMRLSRNKIVRNLSGAYIAVFRSTPMMVQLYIIFYGLFSVIKIPSVVILGFIDLSRFIPGVVALALNSSAYVAEIIRAGIPLLYFLAFITYAQTSQVVFSGCLRGAGDTVYPSVVAVFSMWIVSTLGCYLLAVPLGLGLPGIWIAFAADECLRGLLMQLRWKSGTWRNKSLYSRAKAS